MVCYIKKLTFNFCIRRVGIDVLDLYIYVRDAHNIRLLYFNSPLCTRRFLTYNSFSPPSHTRGLFSIGIEPNLNYCCRHSSSCNIQGEYERYVLSCFFLLLSQVASSPRNKGILRLK